MVDKKQNRDDFLDDFVVKVRKPQSEDRPLLPELKRLPATIKQIKKKYLPRSKTTRAHFTFIISSGKYKSQYAWGSVPLHNEVTDKADLYKWICNILGKESLSVDDSVTLGDLVGRPVEIMVKNTKVNGKIYQNVTEVLTPENGVEEKITEVEKREEEETEEEIIAEESESSDDELDVTEESEEISEDDLPF